MTAAPANSHALVIGKFYPPHAGHHLLIGSAAATCARVSVVVMAASQESIPLAARIAWLREVHAATPQVTVTGIVDDVRMDLHDPAIWQAHVDLMRQALAGIAAPPVTAVFTSEPYGVELAAFRMARPYDATDPVGSSFAGLGDYRRTGEQVHTGVEASGRLRLGPLDLGGAATWLRARATGTGVAAYDGVQLQNVPRLRSRLDARYTLPAAATTFSAALTQVGERNAQRDGLVRAPGYATLDVGAEWRCGCIRGTDSTLAVGIRNLAGKRYWRDVGEAYSADLLFPGAPRSLAVSLVVALP